MVKKRLERFSVDEANELFRRNGVNIYGQEAFIELYAKHGEDFSHVWFEELMFRARRGEGNRVSTEVTGRYCVKRNVEGKRERYEKEFKGLEGEKIQSIKEGWYRLRYRIVRD